MSDQDWLNDLIARAKGRLDEIEVQQPKSYTHGFVEGTLERTAAELAFIEHRHFMTEPLVFGVLANLRRLEMFACQTDVGTLLWLPTEGLRVLQLLSKQMDTSVHWLSIYERSTMRAYIRFQSGAVTRRVLDNEVYWERNILYGEDLAGRGQRTYKSLDDFLAAIQNDYVPKDEKWSYEDLVREPHPEFVKLEWNRRD